MVNSVFGKILNLIWLNLMLLGKFPMLLMAKNKKTKLTIWSHCMEPIFSMRIRNLNNNLCLAFLLHRTIQFKLETPTYEADVKHLSSV